VTQGWAERVVEVDAAGQVLWQWAVRRPKSATRLPNGHVLVTTPVGPRDMVVELDRAGVEVWAVCAEGPLAQARRY
jgi:hypothetical protein